MCWTIRVRKSAAPGQASLDVKTSNYQTETVVLCRLITTPIPADSNPALQLLVRFGCILRNNTAFGKSSLMLQPQQLLQLEQVLRDLRSRFGLMFSSVKEIRSIQALIS